MSKPEFETWLASRIAEEKRLAARENAFSGKHRLTFQVLEEVLENYQSSKDDDVQV